MVRLEFVSGAAAVDYQMDHDQEMSKRRADDEMDKIKKEIRHGK